MSFRPLQVADRVLFGKWAGTEIKLKGEDLIIIKQSDLFGVVDKTAPAKAA